MPISEKIKKHIESLDDKIELKELILAILTEEDKGNYRFKDTYENIVNEYLDKIGSDGQ